MINLNHARLEHFHKYCSRAVGKNEGAVFLGFRLRFGSVTGRSGHAPSLSLAKTPKILAPHGYSISSNALALLLFVLLAIFSTSGQAQTVVITNYTFNTPASASPPAWGVWPNGIDNYVTNGWSSSDASNNPSSGSLLITSTFTGASEQSVVWSGQSGDYNPPLNGSLISNFSCYIRFAPSSPTNATTSSYGSIAFYLNTIPDGAYPPTQIGTYYSVPAGDTNWVFFSVPVSVSGNVYGITIQLETYGNALTGTSEMYVDDVTLTEPAPMSGTSTVDWNTVYQRIDGFGASSAFSGINWTMNQANMYFSTNSGTGLSQNGTNFSFTGIGLSLLRNQIQPAPANGIAYASSSELGLMRMAQALGVRIWSTPWSPPTQFKSNGNEDGGGYVESPANNQAYANQLAGYVASLTNSGINLYAVSVQNEPDANVTSYASCNWNAEQIHDFVPYLYNALAASNASSTMIMLPESENWQDYSNLAVTAMTDPSVAPDVGIIADHNYDGANGPATLTKTNYPGTALWETEVSTFDAFDGSITNALYWASRIHLFMMVAQVNAYHFWWLIDSSTNADNEGLTDTNWVPAKRMYALGNFSRFVRPGYYRMNATDNTGNVLISAYQNTNSGNFAIVAINTNAFAINQTNSLVNFPGTVSSVTPWITSATMSLAVQSPVAVSGSSFSYTLPAQSVVTFVGQVSYTPPVLTPVANQTINAGQTLMVTNMVTDPSVPPLTLTFSLLSGPGAINSSSGIYTWRPPVSQANTTNPVTVTVADSETPSMSATNSFNVIVNPLILPSVSSVTTSGGQVTLVATGTEGPDYTVLTSTNLTAPLITWQALLTTNSPVTPVTLVVTNFNNPVRFYRIEIGP
jgi:glucuronoarabinoxylan endo-1,4-beta-xylanase